MFVVKFRKLLLIVLLSVAFLLTAICVPTAVKATSPKPAYTVVVDAGHGGIDGGVQGVNTGVYERELNLSIAYKVKAELEKAQINVVMTRTTSDGALDTMLTQKQEDMEKRKKIILEASPDCVVSIHQNKYTQQSRRGAQAFFWGDSTLADVLQAALNEKLNKVNTGRTFSALKGDYYILRQTPYPSALVECGFLSNPLDEALLVTDEYQNKVAKVIADSIISFLMSA